MKIVRWFRAAGFAVITLMYSLALAAQGGDQAGALGDYMQAGTRVYLHLSRPPLHVGYLRSPGGRPRGLNYAVDGDTVTVTEAATGNSTVFRIEADNLTGPDGTAWVRVGGAPTPTAAPEPAPATAGDGGQGAGPETYVSRLSGSQLTLLLDGSSMSVGRDGQRSPGHWSSVYGPKHEGSLLTVTPSGIGRSAKLKVQGGKLLDQDTGEEWVRAEDASADAPEAAPAPAPAQMPAIAPPPPPADAPPPTIELGQTKDQVTGAFGQPVRVAKLGVKEIYYYKDMKVTFTNGKVSNVE